MNRYYYSDTISNFIDSPVNEILGELSRKSEHSLLQTQIGAWENQIEILKVSLQEFDGAIYFEFSIPRMGRRIDVVLIIDKVIFVLEFKVGEKEYLLSAFDQVYDYSLDLKNFHETSHQHLIAPILIPTEANDIDFEIKKTHHGDNLLIPIKTNPRLLTSVINKVLDFADGDSIDISNWATGRYSPTPTIIEAAISLFNKHSVEEISRNDASATNLEITSNTVSEIIEKAKKNNEKIICFVTGVPGAGKTLVGLEIANKHLDTEKLTTSVFLSGNGPLVNVLREALTRDKIIREKEIGNKLKKYEVLSSVKAFIQNIHHFRDDCLEDINPPIDHVAIFDEAQRAWDLKQTSDYMRRKRNIPNFSQSEPEFLISCLNRHKDWAVIVCLVGGGQEIHTGEAGISEWIESLNRSFPDWRIYISSKLNDTEYSAGNALALIENREDVFYKDELHLAVSMRSFRAENVSKLVKSILDFEEEEAKLNLEMLTDKYPIVISRDLSKSKNWLREKARGSERYGLVVSSQAQRLKPYAIDVKSPMNPIHWFLNDKKDVRSSYYLEDVATEFQIQGLELDWVCVAWDGDFRYSNNKWNTFSFVGDKWQNINKAERKKYLKNAYRVLLTRARQGMVIFIPKGSTNDTTRSPQYYDGTYEYLKRIGFSEI